MTDKPKHSPLPWRICGDDRGGCDCGQIWCIERDHPVCTVVINKWGDPMPYIDKEGEAALRLVEYGSIPKETGHANADLIIRAVNNLPDVIHELKEWKKYCEDPKINFDMAAKHLDNLLARLEGNDEN